MPMTIVGVSPAMSLSEMGTFFSRSTAERRVSSSRRSEMEAIWTPRLEPGQRLRETAHHVRVVRGERELIERLDLEDPAQIVDKAAQLVGARQRLVVVHDPVQEIQVCLSIVPIFEEFALLSECIPVLRDVAACPFAVI